MTSTQNLEKPDALDRRLEALFDTVAQQLPASEALVAAVLARIESQLRWRRKVLFRAAVGGLLLMLGSALLWTSSWSWLFVAVDAASEFSLPEVVGLRDLDLARLMQPAVIAPLLALLLWPLLLESRASLQ